MTYFIQINFIKNVLNKKRRGRCFIAYVRFSLRIKNVILYWHASAAKKNWRSPTDLSSACLVNKHKNGAEMRENAMKTTVAIVGLGSRGRVTYAPIAKQYPDLMEITALADINPACVEEAAKKSTTYRRSAALRVRKSFWHSRSWQMRFLSALRIRIMSGKR